MSCYQIVDAFSCTQTENILEFSAIASIITVFFILFFAWRKKK